MFNVLFQPAKKPDHTPKEKETTSGENQVQFKNVLWNLLNLWQQRIKWWQPISVAYCKLNHSSTF